MLFVSGTADPFATPALLTESLKDIPNATLHWIDGANHGLKVKGRTSEDVLNEVVTTISGWIG
jgi:pimeloyl-ACP methyl ester carboxylesterase